MQMRNLFRNEDTADSLQINILGIYLSFKKFI